MDLTPVRIRGKKRKHPKFAAIASPASQTPQPSKRNRTPKTSKSGKTKPITMSATPTLQGLPQELLEMIFLHSMNISLPRASPALGRKLSSRSVSLEFVMRNFFNTVDHKANIRDRRNTSDPVIQSELLACRFFTWDFFLLYAQKAHAALIKLRGRIWEKAGIDVPGVGAFRDLWPHLFTRITYLGFAEKFHIPEKLLHGPWDVGRASLLYVLVSMSGEIDWEGSMAGETAKEGIKQAIHAGNERVVAALSVLLGVPRVIDTDMIRHAVIDCGCDINILRHLLFNAQIFASEVPKEQLDFHDPALWAWADKNRDKGDMLKDMLRSAEGFSLKFYFDTESVWNIIVAFPYSGYKFDVRTTFDAFVRELLMNLYRNYGRRITRGRRERSQSVVLDQGGDD